MQPLFAIPASHQKGCTLPGLNVNTKRGAPRPGEEYPPESKEHKVSRMKLQYNTSLVEGDSREALGKRILSGLQDGEGNFKNKMGQHAADDEALAWMRNERKRADDRAEKRWRAKFQEWARNTGEEDEGISHSASAPSLRRPGAGGKGPLAAGDELVKAARELRNLRRSLAEEQEKLEDTQRSLEDMETDRDAWRLRTAQLEDHLSQVLAEKHGTKQKVAELGRLLCTVGSEGIPLGQAPAASQPPPTPKRQPQQQPPTPAAAAVAPASPSASSSASASAPLEASATEELDTSGSAAVGPLEAEAADEDRPCELDEVDVAALAANAARGTR